MSKEKSSPAKPRITNSKARDSGSKLIFGNAELCSQFLRNYMDIPLLKNVRAEDIEDITERYVPMFTEERNSDTVKRIKISENNTFYFVSLIEHKTKVDYNVSMQMLRYMVYIWEDYEREMERKKKGISKTKNFRYPPVLPIVYYEGNRTWTAPCNIKERIIFDEAFEPFTPNFFYKLVQLNAYSVGDLVEKKDELSLLMLINRLQSTAAFRELNLPKDYLKNLSENSTEDLLDIISRVTSSMLRRLDLPEDEITEFTEQVKERNMAELFENFVDDIGLIPKIKLAREKMIAEENVIREKWAAEDKALREKWAAEDRALREERIRVENSLNKAIAEEKALREERIKAENSLDKAIAEEKALREERIKAENAANKAIAEVKTIRENAIAEGHAAGLSEGETRFARLTQFLLETNRLEDLAKAAVDKDFRDKLYLENDLCQ